MATLNIVLVEPEIPQNTGNIARTCAVTGAALHLVGPMGFTPDDKKLRHAGLDYWQYLSLFYYPSLPEFFEKNAGNFFYFSTKAPQRHSDVRYPDPCWLFFGRESAGLPEKLLFENQARCVRIPMMQGARSLNLANSVAVGVFEVLRQWDYPELACRGELRDYDWAAAKAAFPRSEFL
ncbi:tRNA (cytidine(34)-2'-O)-methyltransferase [Acutalibacter caecimuris]|uniref:tRNA (cytidine(34)-2'-O)-methyltransferase n=1 Tax=Acutalibacter caecimuris TaxID=3093657 RepID=UPI002AC90C99|nr:tRNA (cytidine(34)-2'-O)-methyltransferase [Acutalibacter sp. M00118]